VTRSVFPSHADALGKREAELEKITAVNVFRGYRAPKSRKIVPPREVCTPDTTPRMVTVLPTKCTAESGATTSCCAARLAGAPADSARAASTSAAGRAAHVFPIECMVIFPEGVATTMGTP